MQNTVIYLIAFPGVGKYTTAKAICERDDGFKLVDNHLINNPVFSLIEQDGATPLSDRVWDNVSTIWGAVLDTMTHISPRSYSFVLTNVLFDHDPDDRMHFNRIEAMAEARKALFVPVHLFCGVDENKKRIIGPDRAARFKEIRPEAAEYNAENRELLRVDHPHFLELDITNSSPEETARHILEYAEQLRG